MATCYRHPSRETGVSCSNCGRPICPDCMTPTPVGMRCPECARQRTKVKTMRSISTISRGLIVTRSLIAINVIAFLAEGSFTIGTTAPTGWVYQHGALFGPSIAVNHEYWRLITGGFLHAGLLHIAFNMYLLYLLGQMLEPALGSVRFSAIYFTALLAGSFGSLWATPLSPTVGASGAVFGLMGAAVVEMRDRGMSIHPLQNQIVGLIVINLILSFSFSGVSVGGHIGGLIGGALAGGAFLLARRQREIRSLTLGLVVCLALSALAVTGAIAVAGHMSGLTF
jgi:membrane associated rhomboid family serine protease